MREAMPNTKRAYRPKRTSNALSSCACKSAINSSSRGDGIGDASGSGTTGVWSLLQTKGSASARPFGGELIRLSHFALYGDGRPHSLPSRHHTTADDRFFRQKRSLKPLLKSAPSWYSFAPRAVYMSARAYRSQGRCAHSLLGPRCRNSDLRAEVK